jgi:hypothetical protein
MDYGKKNMKKKSKRRKEEKEAETECVTQFRNTRENETNETTLV